MNQVILASASPRRKEILEIMNIPYKIMTENVEEITNESIPSEMVKSLARLKTKAVDQMLCDNGEEEDRLILGADTMVFYQEHALGKPKNREDAVRMLQLLSGDVHQVYSGVSVLITHQGGVKEELSFAVRTDVHVYPLTTAQIFDYIDSGEPMDKAGAYGIQGLFGLYIKEIQGDYYNVMGLPIAAIYENLLKIGIDLKKLK